MANFGWAYINCSDTGSTGATSAGPMGAVQFAHGTGSMTGSVRFRYLTGAYGEHTGSSTLVLSGNMVITGTLSASVIHYSDVTRIDATGSTFFGNTIDDIHSRTGSLEIWSGTTPVLSASSYSKQVFVKGFGGGYRNVTSRSPKKGSSIRGLIRKLSTRFASSTIGRRRWSSRDLPDTTRPSFSSTGVQATSMPRASARTSYGRSRRQITSI